jgi:hypothetical protein
VQIPNMLQRRSVPLSNQNITIPPTHNRQEPYICASRKQQATEFKGFVLKYIPTSDNCAHTFTKPLDRVTLSRHRDFICNIHLYKRGAREA